MYIALCVQCAKSNLALENSCTYYRYVTSVSWYCTCVHEKTVCYAAHVNFTPEYTCTYILQGVGLASLAHSLLVHGFYLFIYCMEGYCVHGTSACSMNNKQWLKGQVYSKLQASLCCTVPSHPRPALRVEFVV